MIGNWFYTPAYVVFDNGRMAKKRFSPDNLMRWTTDKGFTRGVIEKVCKSTRACLF